MLGRRDSIIPKGLLKCFCNINGLDRLIFKKLRVPNSLYKKRISMSKEVNLPSGGGI